MERTNNILLQTTIGTHMSQLIGSTVTTPFTHAILLLKLYTILLSSPCLIFLFLLTTGIHILGIVRLPLLLRFG